MVSLQSIRCLLCRSQHPDHRCDCWAAKQNSAHVEWRKTAMSRESLPKCLVKQRQMCAECPCCSSWGCCVECMHCQRFYLTGIVMQEMMFHELYSSYMKPPALAQWSMQAVIVRCHWIATFSHLCFLLENGTNHISLLKDYRMQEHSN